MTRLRWYYLWHEAEIVEDHGDGWVTPWRIRELGHSFVRLSFWPYTWRAIGSTLTQ